MIRARAILLQNCCLIAAVLVVCARCVAQTSDSPVTRPSSPSETNGASGDTEKPDRVAANTKDSDDQDGAQNNAIGVSFLKNLVSDQKTIWTSPKHLHWADGTWLFPLAAATGAFFATDRAVPPALTADPNKLHRYVSISNYGLYSMIGAGGGLYVWGRLSHNDHQRETGVLAGEAAIDSFAVASALRFRRRR